MNEFEEVEIGESMVQQRDIQLTNYIPGARALVGKTAPPRPSVVIPARGRKRQRVVDSLGVQAGVQHGEYDAPTTLVIADPSISQLNIPTDGSGNPPPTIGIEGASSSTLPHLGY